MPLVSSSSEAMSKTVVNPQRVNICSICAESSFDDSFSSSSSRWVSTCTWLFQNPAVTTFPWQLMIVTALANRGDLVLALGPTAVIRPSWITIVPSSIGGSVGDT